MVYMMVYVITHTHVVHTHTHTHTPPLAVSLFLRYLRPSRCRGARNGTGPRQTRAPQVLCCLPIDRPSGSVRHCTSHSVYFSYQQLVPILVDYIRIAVYLPGAHACSSSRSISISSSSSNTCLLPLLPQVLCILCIEWDDPYHAVLCRQSAEHESLPGQHR